MKSEKKVQNEKFNSISIYFPLNSKSETSTIKYGEYQSSQEGGQQ